MSTDPGPGERASLLGWFFRLSPLMQAACFMVIASFGFQAMNGVIKHLSTEIHPFEIGFFRNIFGLVALAPFFVRYRLEVFRTEKFGLHLLRGAINVVSMLCFFYAISIAPLAKLASLAFTLPLWVTVFAVIFLGERLRSRRILALVVGTIGALIIIRPGTEAMNLGSLLVLAGTAIWGLALMTIKVLARTESNLSITAWAAVLLAAFSLPPALLHWTWPSPGEFAWLALVGGLGSLGVMATAQAFRLAEANALMPFDFFKLIWAAAIGYIFFAEVPDIWTWLGGAVIFLSTVYLGYRESQLKKQGELKHETGPVSQI